MQLQRIRMAYERVQPKMDIFWLNLKYEDTFKIILKIILHVHFYVHWYTESAQRGHAPRAQPHCRLFYPPDKLAYNQTQPDQL